MYASGYRKSGDDWLKKIAGQGFGVIGMAIDPITWQMKAGPKGTDHTRAYYELIEKLRDEEPNPDLWDQIEWRVKKVYVIEAENWQFPFVMIERWSQLTRKELKAIEEKLLEFGIGLPLSSLMLERNPALARMMPLDKAD